MDPTCTRRSRERRNSLATSPSSMPLFSISSCQETPDAHASTMPAYFLSNPAGIWGAKP
jgi:hypothetical protein